MTLLPSPSEFSPLEEQFHTWDIVLRNPFDQTKVLSLWSSISITETHEGIRTQIEINAEEPAIPFIRELVTDFMFYRDGQLLYRLRVVDSEDVLTRDAATVRFDCVSYDKLLERRILHEDWLLDDGDINAAWRLIDYTQRKLSFGITRGTTQPGSRRQRALDAGDDILTSINDFAQADGGFDWWIDAELKFWAVKPRRGKTHTIQWQLGGEVAEMTRLNPIEDYASLIMATGANSEVRIPRADGNEDVYPPPDPQIVQLISKPLGLWEMTTSDTDVITTASLVEKAKWHLGDKGIVRPSYKVMLEPGVWQPTIGVGDIITLRINTVRANVKVPIRIEEIQINCTSDGAETISLAVRAEEPETPISVTGGPAPLPTLLADGPTPNGRTVARHRLSEADDLGALLRSLRKRLDRAERSRGIGGGGGANILDGEGPPPASIGSPGDYYVDTIGQQLYGPKDDGALAYPPSVIWETQPANAVRLNQECSIIIYGDWDFDILGFRYGGHPEASDLTITIWDYYSKEVLYQTTGPGTGSDGIVPTPPIHARRADDYAGNGGAQYVVSLGGAAVPVHQPGGTQPTNLPEFISMISPQGLYTAPLGVRETNWVGEVASLDLQLLVRLDRPIIVGPEVCITNPGMPMPNRNIAGEVGQFGGLQVYTNPARLVGWRYRRLATSTSPMDWRVWKTLSPGATNTGPPSGEVLAEITTNDVDEGEYEVRLPSPVTLDPTGLDGEQSVMIAAAGEAVPIYDIETFAPNRPLYPSWYWFGHTPMYNETIGELPYHGVPGLPAVWGGTILVFPIMQQITEPWPLSNASRSDDPPKQRAELRRKMDFVDEYWTEDDGLHFYEGGPSHPHQDYSPTLASTAAGGDGISSDISWWDVTFRYDGNSGVMLETNWWYNDYFRKRPGETTPRSGWLSNVGAWYASYWDYAYQEQDCDLDEFDPYFPGSYYMTYNSQSTWDDLATTALEAYGPNHGGGLFEDGVRINYGNDGGAIIGVEVTEYGNEPNVNTGAVARMLAAADDDLWGTSISVTPRVIQASFPPYEYGGAGTWWNPGYLTALTPKGCLSPLITAASDTPTAEDEPWQRQFFRQIGLNDVAFTAGVGTVNVPTAMAPPYVVHASVDGATPGGHRVSQCQVASDYQITVALDTTHTGTVPINWSVEAAALTFGTPPPGLSWFGNPGTLFLYANTVDYDVGGGTWPFEVPGVYFADGCVLKDFTGATVGGPFTPTVTEDGRTWFNWSAGRDWYLPSETQQYRLENPDGQVSNWVTITWVDTVGALMAKESVLGSQRKMNAMGITPNMVEDAALLPKPGVSNDPRRRPPSQVINPLRADAEPTRRRGGKQNRQAQKEWVQQQQDMRRNPQPDDETTGP